MTENQKRRFEDRIPAKPLDWNDAQVEQSITVDAASDNGSQASSVLTDERIVQVWQSMPGGPNGWLKEFGYLQFARAIEAEVLAQAGVRAEPANLDKLGGAIKMVVNMLSRDNTPVRIEAAGALLAAFGEVAAPPTPAQVPAAEVRAQALREAAELCGSIYQNHRDQYKGRGKYAPPADNPRRADTHCDGCADGAAECEEAILALAQSSTADKASEVRAAEVRVMPEVVQSFALEDGRCVMGDPDLGALKDGTYWICKAPIYHAAPSTADSGNTSALGEGAEA